MNRTLLTTLLGLTSGIIGGAFGLGGSFIMMPGVILLGIIPDYKTAVGTILFSLLPPVSILAVIEYYKRKQIDTKVGMILFVTYMIAAYFGSFINKAYSNKVLEFWSGIVFLIIALLFFWEAYTTKK